MVQGFRVGFLLSLLLAFALGVNACGNGSSTTAELPLHPTPKGFEFDGREIKSVSIHLAGSNPVAVSKEYIAGPDKSSFSLPSGEHCEVEFSSINKECAEIVQLDDPGSGLSAKLVLENRDGSLEIPISG